MFLLWLRPPNVGIRPLLHFPPLIKGKGWDGWMASLTQWTWVWINSGSWLWTGRPGVLQSMGSQRVGHDWATELTEMKWESDSPCHCHTYPRWHSGWELEFRDCGAIPGQGLLLTAERRTEGMWRRTLVGNAHGGKPGSQGSKACVGGGAISITSLPDTPASAAERERLAHQTPDALN